ncbi:hypothetical protein [Massilia endophytica]|uniref:hypothetical protein n=1 Tax=Massilia endophytica TaxID=2899220 RepID=UPI001E5CC15A|nr:hypothetical protein [Massilia endophytica]UGQ45065.1 hypothetical protein LSQ66_14825 [Massilia endophytica]
MTITYIESNDDCRPLTEIDRARLTKELRLATEEVAFLNDHILDMGASHLWWNREQDRRYILKQLAAGSFLPFEEEDLTKPFLLPNPIVEGFA